MSHVPIIVNIIGRDENILQNDFTFYHIKFLGH